MSHPRKYGVLPWLQALLLAAILAEPAHAQQGALEAYVRMGLEDNLALKQKQLDYSISLAALREARGLFFPQVSFNARYTVADGGRMISFPVGDLMNPVYSTLNLLTASDLFPQIENETFPFLRPHEQETKFSLVQPIFSPEVFYNQRIRKQQHEIYRIGLDQYRRELVREIRIAYHDYQKALNMAALSDTTFQLVQENLRVSRRLFENDKVTVDAVFRSESELSRIEVQQAEADQLLEVTRAYFNFLLNRPLDAPIEPSNLVPLPPQVSLDEAVMIALQGRDELTQIDQYRMLNEHVTGLYRGYSLPGLYGAVEYGIQGEDYRISGEDDFVIASLVMRWNLFQGSVNRQKVNQSVLEGEKLQTLYEETAQKIRLEVINHYYALEAAYASVESTRKQLLSARRAYELISRKYTEGQSPLLELIDARTSMTGAATSAILASNEYFSALARFEYAMGTGGIETYQP